MNLWHALSSCEGPVRSFLWGKEAGVALADLANGSTLSVPAEELCGRSVLVATSDQLATALALIELDGVAGNLVLCPTDLPLEQLQFLATSVEADAIVTDRHDVLKADTLASTLRVTCSSRILPTNDKPHRAYKTQWILLTSGTTGRPKLVQHNLATLAGAIQIQSAPSEPRVWSTFYDIRRYGGLQIFLRAMLARESLVLSSADETTVDFLSRAGSHAVTHISGTPSHWRRALMSGEAIQIDPKYIRLSGEIADQGILDRLRAFYPKSVIVHAFATTEAGLAFEVTDGRAGFPATLLNMESHDVQIKVADGSLRIRSSRSALRYLGQNAKDIADHDGFVDTKDVVDRREDRCYFVGRGDGVINVGGLKVHPEEVESVINTHPQVQMSLVRSRKSPITGGMVVADILLDRERNNETERQAVEDQILQLCRKMLPRHKVPVAMYFLEKLPVAETGKLAR